MTRTRTTRLSLSLVATAGLGWLAGCSSGANESLAQSSQALGITVELPKALGGGLETTFLVPAGSPAALYSLGLTDAPTPTPPDGTQDNAGLVDGNTGGGGGDDNDISMWAPPPGNQAAYGSCASWASGYSSLGWWVNAEGGVGNPFNPVFLYDLTMKATGQSCSGDHGSSLEQPLILLKSEGNTPRASYASAACEPPSAAQLKAASAYKISGYALPFVELGQCSGSYDTSKSCVRSHQGALTAAIASGPVVLGFQVYSEFMGAGSGSYLVGLPHKGSTYFGGHAVAAMKVDSKGVWILNSWGPGWGRSGWAELTWDFINSSYVYDAAQINGLAESPPKPPPATPDCSHRSGWNCGNDGVLHGDPHTNYLCELGQVAPLESIRCAGACTIEPNGQPDVCAGSPDCSKRSGWNCGSDGVIDGDPSTNYFCKLGQAAPEQTVYCVDGCVIMPNGTPDHCQAE